MKEYLIYKHTSPSGKMYIGITNDYSRRCREHLSKASRGLGYAFHNAIRKYGWNAFKHEVVIGNLTLDEACSFETILIKELNTLVPNGYNVAEGGNVMSGTTRRASQLKAREGKFNGYTLNNGMYSVTRSYYRENLYFKSFANEEEARDYSLWLYTLTDEELLVEYNTLKQLRAIPTVSVSCTNGKYRVRATLGGVVKSFGSFSTRTEAELLRDQIQGKTVEELSLLTTALGTKGYSYDKSRNKYLVNFSYEGKRVTKRFITEQEAMEYVADVRSGHVQVGT